MCLSPTSRGITPIFPPSHIINNKFVIKFTGDAPHTSTAEQQRKRVELHPVLQKFLPLSEGLDPAAELSKVVRVQLTANIFESGPKPTP